MLLLCINRNTSKDFDTLTNVAVWLVYFSELSTEENSAVLTPEIAFNLQQFEFYRCFKSVTDCVFLVAIRYVK
jgi:hypothetical protein